MFATDPMMVRHPAIVDTYASMYQNIVSCPTKCPTQSRAMSTNGTLENT